MEPTTLPSCCDDALRDLLTAAGRSLTQYLGEVPPWTDPGEGQIRETLARLVSQQQQSVAAVAGLLAERHAAAEHDVYPPEFMILNDLAFGFVLDRLIDNQRQVAASAAAAMQTCGGAAGAVLKAVERREREHLETLRSLAEAQVVCP